MPARPAAPRRLARLAQSAAWLRAVLVDALAALLTRLLTGLLTSAMCLTEAPSASAAGTTPFHVCFRVIRF